MMRKFLAAIATVSAASAVNVAYNRIDKTQARE